MADNPAKRDDPRPALHISGNTGRLPSSNQLPSKKGGTGKIVVMLSSVAKRPAGTQALPAVSAPVQAPPTVTSVETGSVKQQPPPLPPKQVAPAANPASPRLSTTTYVKLPPKTSIPPWSSVAAAMPDKTPAPQIVPPPLPLKRPEAARPEAKRTGANLIPPIRLNAPPAANADEESIILPASQKQPAAAASRKSPESESLRNPADTPAPASRPQQVEAKVAPLIAPPLMPPSRSGPVSAVEKNAPPHLPPVSVEPVPLHVAPPMAERAGESLSDKLPPPLKPPTPSTAAPAEVPPLQVAPPLAEHASDHPSEKLPPPLIPPSSPAAASVAPSLHVAPPMTEHPGAHGSEKLPPPLIPPSAPSAAAVDPALNVAPPLVAKALDQPVPGAKPPATTLPPSVGKTSEPLPSPELPSAGPVGATLPGLELPLPLAESQATKAPALPATDTPVSEGKPTAVPGGPAIVKTPGPGGPKPVKALSRLSSTIRLPFGRSKPAQSTPLVVSSQGTPAVESKPALKPAVLSKRAMVPKLVDADPAAPDAAAEGKSGAADLPLPVATSAAPSAEAKPPTKSAAETPVTPSPLKTAEASAAALTMAEAVALFGEPKQAVVPEGQPLAAPLPGGSKAPLPATRTERARKRKLISTVVFYSLMVVAGATLYFGGLYFGHETRVEGQVIPPPGMTLHNEVWIVSDFRELAAGVAEDLAADRAPLMQQIQERQEHVQRAQADIASREERIRLINQEIEGAKNDITNVVKQSNDATQQIWDGPGAQLDAEYASRLTQLEHAIADRAKSLHLKYDPDPAFRSPEVWANAYRLALYEIPPTIDGVKEHQWLGDQLKAWRDFVKTLDDRKEQLREQAAALKTAPAPKIADLNSKIDDDQHRIDATEAEEGPLKTELQQAQGELAAAQAADAGLDDKYIKQLDALPAQAITKRIPLFANGRFSWVEDDAFIEGETEHRYWLFSRATRADGRQYWSLAHIALKKNEKLCLIMDPESFVSTKAILRPNLSPEEQEQ